MDFSFKQNKRRCPLVLRKVVSDDSGVVKAFKGGYFTAFVTVSSVVNKDLTLKAKDNNTDCIFGTSRYEANAMYSFSSVFMHSIIYTVSQKRIPDIIDYSLKKDYIFQ